MLLALAEGFLNCLPLCHTEWVRASSRRASLGRLMTGFGESRLPGVHDGEGSAMTDHTFRGHWPSAGLAGAGRAVGRRPRVGSRSAGWRRGRGPGRPRVRKPSPAVPTPSSQHRRVQTPGHRGSPAAMLPGPSSGRLLCPKVGERTCRWSVLIIGIGLMSGPD